LDTGFSFSAVFNVFTAVTQLHDGYLAISPREIPFADSALHILSQGFRAIPEDIHDVSLGNTAQLGKETHGDATLFIPDEPAHLESLTHAW